MTENEDVKEKSDEGIDWGIELQEGKQSKCFLTADELSCKD